MSKKTLQYDSACKVRALFANDEQNLRLIEEQFGVSLVSRDTFIKIEGPAKEITKTVELFRVLEEAYQEGIPIKKSEFLYALNSLVDGKKKNSKQIFSEKIEVPSKKKVISPRTPGQKKYIEAIRGNDLVFSIGPAGTGKTYLAMALAVEALFKGSVRRIILSRPAVEAGETLGFLPGDLYEKITPYLRPLYDALYDMMDVDSIQRNIAKGIIEIAPLAYMRGRTLNDSFIILDEAQNSTIEQMKMFLTRLGYGSKAVITGDITQVDLPSNKTSGLIQVTHILKGIKGIEFSYFTDKDVVRHPLVQNIVQAYQKYDETSPKKEETN